MKEKKVLKFIIRAVLPFIALLFVIMILLKGFTYFESINQVQSKELLEQSVRRATVECYAVEGAYPITLEYLEENYGISYDKNKYEVEYGCWSSNQMPTIIVNEK
ncbi:MAG: hypothetical protein Q4F05_00570 [bacterium]|nr:hypothetical protein [bacterium]